MLMPLNQTSKSDQSSSPLVIPNDAIEVFFDPLINIDQRVTDLIAPTDQSASQREDFHACLLLEERTIPQQTF
jgi:hypothetical protein